MRYFAILLFLVLPLAISAQPARNASERIQEEKVAFFNRELDLTKAEEKAFWPVYNDYQNRKNKIVAEKRTLMRYYKENERNMAEKEISEVLEKYIKLEKDETALLEDYTQKFRLILPDEKVLRIFIAEVNFKDYLLKRLRTR